MSPISHISRAPYCPVSQKGFLTSASDIVKKVAGFVIGYFAALQNACFLTYGIKELISGIGKNFEIKTIKESQNHKQQSSFDQCLLRIDLWTANNLITHGALYSGSGACGVIAGLHQAGKLNIGPAFPFIDFLCNGLFLVASIVSLKYYVKIYDKASSIPDNAPPKELEVAKSLKWAAILGIISTLTALATSVVALLSLSTTIALIVGCIAAFTGCIRVIYDYWVLQPMLQKLNVQPPASVL